MDGLERSFNGGAGGKTRCQRRTGGGHLIRVSRVKPLKKFCCLKKKKEAKSDGEWVVRREAESRQGLGYAMD